MTETDRTQTANSPKKDVELEKNYGKIACRGLLGAAQLSRCRQDEKPSKGFSSQTGSKEYA